MIQYLPDASPQRGGEPTGGAATAIARAALDLGFARVGFCGVEPFAEGAGRLRDWLAAGHQGEMKYLSAGPRHDPRALLASAQTLVVVALPYGQPAGRSPRRRLPVAGGRHPAGSDEKPGGAHLSQDTAREAGLAPPPPLGKVARYARGSDYHTVLASKLQDLAQTCSNLLGRSVLARSCVDAAPLLEHEAARRAGVGFVAKSTLTLAPGLGTFFLLGELLLDVQLPPSTPSQEACGSCRACLDACPTGAFVEARVLDARRCISYLTIELRGSIPRQLRPSVGLWVMGCDICQEVCPFNQTRKRPAPAPELEPRPELSTPSLLALLELRSAAYRRLVRGSAWRRLSRTRIQRNAAVALGNSGASSAIGPLGRVLRESPSALVREHCAWALGRLGGAQARTLLQEAAGRAQEPPVAKEIRLSLQEMDRPPNGGGPALASERVEQG